MANKSLIMRHKGLTAVFITLGFVVVPALLTMSDNRQRPQRGEPTKPASLSSVVATKKCEERASLNGANFSFSHQQTVAGLDGSITARGFIEFTAPGGFISIYSYTCIFKDGKLSNYSSKLM